MKMRIHHVLLYRFKPGIDRIDEHLRAILAFRDTTEGLLDLKCGRNVAERYAGRFTHGFVMTFESAEDLDRYNRSEAHGDLVARFKDDVEGKLVFDFYSP
jgi:hypothetical protein